MGSHGQPDTEPLEPTFEACLNASKTFLCYREFKRCREYAVKARQFNPTHPGPSQLLAIAGVLSACPSETQPEPPNCYSILDLARFTHDQDTIRGKVDLMKDLVNPEKNPYPFAIKAYDWVLKAGSILSDLNSKAQHDRRLNLRLKGEGAAAKGGTFWTMCPYCDCKYEYLSVFLDCVLKCHNEKCRKVFREAVTASAVPTPEVVETAKNLRDGFFPEAPFVSLGSGRKGGEEVRTKGDPKPKIANFSEVIDVTDSDEIEGAEEINKKGDVDGENRGNVGVRRRRKMAALATNKVTGRGFPAMFDPSKRNMKDVEETLDLLFGKENTEGAATSGEQEGLGLDGM